MIDCPLVAATANPIDAPHCSGRKKRQARKPGAPRLKR
jgi:hypothetical protein